MNRYGIAIGFLALAFGVGAALAQPVTHPDPVETFKFLSANDVNGLTDKKAGTGAKTAHIGIHENYDIEYAQRTDSGNEAEIHTHWTHYIHVLSGAATLTYGGKVTSPRDTGPGQVRGSGITGGTSIAVHPGDYMQIPAGMPHLFTVPKGGAMHYVVFNTRD